MVEAWQDILFTKLKEMQKINHGVIDINNLDEIIQQFLEILNPHIVNKEKQDIYHQIELISAKFLSLKKDISNISNEILDHNFVPNINMELRSVVTQTEKSVTGILDVSDEISELSSRVSDPEIKSALMIKATRILELCNFQDLTGQRIQKIVHHLSEIESIMFKMLHALRPDSKLRTRVVSEDELLINGPQGESKSPSQSDIDDLFDKI